MTKLRVYSGSVAKATSLRVYSGSVTGTAPTNPKLRVYSGSVSGAAAIVLKPLTDVTVEPLSPVSITATLDIGSATPTSYSWRRISGPTDYAITASGATVTTTAPAALAGTALVLGVTATNGTTTSTEKTVTINVLPQIDWELTASGWVATRAVVAL